MARKNRGMVYYLVASFLIFLSFCVFVPPKLGQHLLRITHACRSPQSIVGFELHYVRKIASLERKPSAVHYSHFFFISARTAV